MARRSHSRVNRSYRGCGPGHGPSGDPPSETPSAEISILDDASSSLPGLAGLPGASVLQPTSFIDAVPLDRRRVEFHTEAWPIRKHERTIDEPERLANDLLPERVLADLVFDER